MTNYVNLVNQLLIRLNEVTLDTAGSGFGSVRNVQALAKEAINSSIRKVLQDGQEWPFLKVVHTQTLTAATRTYNFPSNASSVDWETFYLKQLGSKENIPRNLDSISYEDYIQNFRSTDDTGNQVSGDGPPEKVYQTFGSAFGVTPVPDDAYEVEFVYWQYPASLTVYNDNCIIPERFDHVILDGAMMYMMRFRSNEQSASIHQSNFEDGIKAMRRVLIDEPLELRSRVINHNRRSGLV